MPNQGFAGRSLPMTIRVARGVLFLQGGILALSGLFVIGVGLLLSADTSVPFGGGSVAGSTAAALGVGYAALGAAAVYLGTVLGHTVSWSRNAVVGFEAVLIVLFMGRGDFSVGFVFSVLLCVAVAVLLVTRSANAVFSPPPRPDVSPAQPES